jgi:alpha-galactosidase
MRMRLQLLALVLAVAAPRAWALDQQPMRAPLMGWSSGRLHGCEVNEDLVRRAADALVSSRLREAGYELVIVDDCWQGGRDGTGSLQPEPRRFPSGIKALVTYVHAHGLKFGLHAASDAKSCDQPPDGDNHAREDARQFAGWGVDYVQRHACSGTGLTVLNTGNSQLSIGEQAMT